MSKVDDLKMDKEELEVQMASLKEDILDFESEIEEGDYTDAEECLLKLTDIENLKEEVEGIHYIIKDLDKEIDKLRCTEKRG